MLQVCQLRLMCDRAGCVCISAPCKVLNGGSRDEVITVWAVAGHHYDLITHNITTKYNYHTFIISRTDLKYALCVLSVTTELHCWVLFA